MANKGTTPWNKGVKTNKPASNRVIIDKDELYDLYINQELTSEEIAEIYNCSSKTIRNWLTKYDIPIRPNGEAVKLQRSKWSDEKELERSRNYHNTWVNKPQEEKDEIVAKRTSSPNINSEEAIKKAIISRNSNKSTFSKAEENFLNKLYILGFDKDDIIHPYYGPEYGDNRYPFNCDYYIKSKDLYIEGQFHQTHGPEPFDENNPDHINLLIKYQDNGYDMSTWFKRDPYKLEVAKENKINLLLVYRNSTYLVQNGNMRTIDINDINKI